MLSTTIDRISLAIDAEASLATLSEMGSYASVLRNYYPEFDLWFSKKVYPQLFTGERAILAEYREGQLAGFAIVKDNGFEQKLCCLRVMPSFQNARGLGLRLFDRTFDYLETDKPVLSVSEEMLPKFNRIFSHFGFKMAQQYDGYYRKEKSEFSFNGLLLPDLTIKCRESYVTEKAA